MALIDEGMLVVVVIPLGNSHKKIMSNLEEVKSRGAHVLAFGAPNDEELFEKAHEIFTINPNISEIIASLVYIVPCQLLSYYITIEKSFDPNKPKNLVKCVTVE